MLKKVINYYLKENINKIESEGYVTNNGIKCGIWKYYNLIGNVYYTSYWYNARLVSKSKYKNLTLKDKIEKLIYK